MAGGGTEGLTVFTRTQALEHSSPTLFCLAATGAAFGVIVVGTAVWNAWEYREELAVAVLRRLDRLHPQ